MVLWSVGENHPGKAPSRYVELAADEAVPEGFLEIDLGGLGPSDGRTAFAWRSGVYRGRQPHVGFHGGCSLEEMVVPLAWLAAEDGRPADLPGWWRGVPATEEPTAQEPTEPTAEEPTAQESMAEPTQIDLFGPEDHGLPADLWASLDDGEKQVLDLLRRNRTARVSELAAQIGRPAGRMSGMMSRLRRRLGPHPRFERELLPSGEGLYRYRAG